MFVLTYFAYSSMALAIKCVCQHFSQDASNFMMRLARTNEETAMVSINSSVSIGEKTTTGSKISHKNLLITD